MSRCLNRATLIGYLSADPEIRPLPGGGRVAHVALATTRHWNDRDGKPREKTQSHRITVWDSLPSTFAFVETYVRKGDRVFVAGEIDYHSYEDRDGLVRWSTESAPPRCSRRGSSRNVQSVREGFPHGGIPHASQHRRRSASPEARVKEV